MHETPPSPLRRQAFIAGVILAGASVLEIAAMAHHPSVRTSATAQAMLEISSMARLAASVHGALLAFMLLAAYGLSEFVLRRDMRQPLIRAGAIAYGAGTIVMLGAAMVSGFVIADLVRLTPHATTVDLQINAQLLVLCGVLNQTCANFAVIAMSAGIALWSVDLLRDLGLPRLIGVLGLLVSTGPALALLLGLLHLDVRGMAAVVLLQAVWNVAIGLAMMRGRI